MASADANARVFELLGVLAQAAGKTEEARRHFMRALSLEPGSLTLQRYLAKLDSKPAARAQPSGSRRRLAAS